MLFEGYRVDCTLKKTQRKTERGRLALQHSSLSTSGGKYLLNIIHLWPPPGSLNASSCGCAAFTEHGHQLQWKVSRWSGVWKSLPGHSVVLQSLKTLTVPACYWLFSQADTRSDTVERAELSQAATWWTLWYRARWRNQLYWNTSSVLINKCLILQHVHVDLLITSNDFIIANKLFANSL